MPFWTYRIRNGDFEQFPLIVARIWKLKNDGNFFHPKNFRKNIESSYTV